MSVTIDLGGHIEQVIGRLISIGVVKTKSEALRLGVLKLEEDYLNEDALELHAAEEAWQGFKEGKNKALSAKEFSRRTGLKV